jgi:hypothetical protein
LVERHYEYRLELNARDEIVGGSWDAGSDRPDFAWVLKGPIPFTGDYARLIPYWKGTSSEN